MRRPEEGLVVEVAEPVMHHPDVHDPLRQPVEGDRHLIEEEVAMAGRPGPFEEPLGLEDLEIQIPIPSISLPGSQRPRLVGPMRVGMAHSSPVSGSFQRP